jgi:L-malate glycosyltransferase
MIRLLYFNYSNALGGAERSLLDLLRGMDNARFRPALLTFGEGPLSRTAREAGIPVHALPEGVDLSPFNRDRLGLSAIRGILRIPGLIRQVGRLRRNLREIRPDILHSNNPKSHVLGGLAAAGLNVPVVFHMRDLFRPLSLSSLLLRLSAAFVPCRVVCISRAVHAGLPAFLRKRSVVIYNGFSPPEIRRNRETVRRELGLGSGEKLLITAGRIVPWKGFPLLISAAAPLLKGGECRLLVLGESIYWRKDYLQEVKAHARRAGVEDRVIFTGFVERPEEMFAASDLFVLPSRNEPFGRVLVEAMLCRLPVVAFNEAGPREIITHGVTGLLAEPGSEASLRAAVETLLRDDARRKAMGEAAFSEAQARFPIRRTLEQLGALYGEILETHDEK